MLPEIVFVTSYPPRECGIATFSQDLVNALNGQFDQSFKLTIAALETEESLSYPPEVQYTLKTRDPESYRNLAKVLNRNSAVEMVVFQHEFGLFGGNESDLVTLMGELSVPVMVVFHTVLPEPNPELQHNVIAIANKCAGVIVMTSHAKHLLTEFYNIPEEQITVIPHGTHLVHHENKETLKQKYGFEGRKVLSTFGLISSGKNIEMTLQALPAVVAQNPDVLFLAIGKTHPEIVKREGESYREMLQKMTVDLGIERNVQFINSYVALPELLEYLQLTDIYLFTSKDPNQAVSGTFSYALSCGCPIISTPIPHALEILGDDLSTIVPFSDAVKLGETINRLLADEQLLRNLRLNALHRMAETGWENVAVKYAHLFHNQSIRPMRLEYRLPSMNLHHLRKLTTSFGMIQFSQLNEPDPASGYTLDDNARALIAVAHHYAVTRDESDLKLIRTYLTFIEFCQRPQGYFLNYVDQNKAFTDQNFATNLSDSNGRAIWALGYVMSLKGTVPETVTDLAEKVLKAAMPRISGMHSTRAMSFAIKGLAYYHSVNQAAGCESYIRVLANRLVQMYLHEAHQGWEWYESYLTYANSLVPEALLCAYEVTQVSVFGEVAKTSFDFLLSHIMTEDGIRVISNNGWMQKGAARHPYGEQPIDVAYTVLALSRFYTCFGEDTYLRQMETAFNWFLGHNHLHRTIYNPCTGGCQDGLEEYHVNLNQGAESTVSYLLARLTMEQHKGDLLHLHQWGGKKERPEKVRSIGRIARKKQFNRKPVVLGTRIMGTYPRF